MDSSTTSSSLLSALNPQQRQAVELVDGPVLILAGAGSGKTRVITYRIAYLMEVCGIHPENILAVTFTNKASNQMKERVFHLLQGKYSSTPLICTFHSFCVRILRKDIGTLGYSRAFVIFDQSDQESLMRTCVKEVGLDPKAVTPRSVLSQVSYAKNHSISPGQFYAMASDPRREQTAILFELYEKKLRQHNALDFDDLLLRTVELLGTHEEVRERYNERFHYILVDEYQDTNQAQYRLIRHLTRRRQNLCVVGDEDQSIYRWRGADIQNILNFEQDYPSSTIIKLEQNYRSTQTILDAASAVVAHNTERKGKALWTRRRGGDRLVYFEAPDAEGEALFAVQSIQSFRREAPEERCAVLYRTNAQSRSLEEAFRRYGLPYRMVGGFSFYDRAEIKDVLSYVKFSLNTDDDIHLERIINTPPRGIGKTTLDLLDAWAKEKNQSRWKSLGSLMEQGNLPERAATALLGFRRLIHSIQERLETTTLPDLLKYVTEASGYRQLLVDEDTDESLSRLENLEELFNAAADAFGRHETLQDFLDHAALVSDQDSYDEAANITLMTIHSAKGLEFPLVMVVGLEEGLFPHSRSMPNQEDLEEERRLFYVAMTRAQNRLYLSRVRMRRHFGAEGSEVTEPSRFLAEIPPELIHDVSGSALTRSRRAFEGKTYNTVDQIQRVLSGHKKEVSKTFAAKSGSLLRSAQPSAIKWKSRFRMGSQVRHPKYGIGTVLRSEGDGEGLKLSVNFPRYGLKKLVEKYAGLEEA